MNEPTIDQLLAILKERFTRNPKRRLEQEWVLIEKKLKAHPGKMATLSKWKAQAANQT